MAGIDLGVEKAAQFFGCNPKTVTRWITDGCPAVKSGRVWALNSAEVSSWLRNRERESVLGEMSNIDETEARRRKIAAEAGREELKLAVESGAVVPIANYESEMAAMIGTARAKLLNIGSKLAPVVVQCENPAEAKDIIDGGVAEVLRELTEVDASESGPASITESEGGVEESCETVGSPARLQRKRVGRPKSKA